MSYIVISEIKRNSVFITSLNITNDTFCVINSKEHKITKTSNHLKDLQELLEFNIKYTNSLSFKNFVKKHIVLYNSLKTNISSTVHELKFNEEISELIKRHKDDYESRAPIECLEILSSRNRSGFTRSDVILTTEFVVKEDFNLMKNFVRSHPLKNTSINPTLPALLKGLPEYDKSKVILSVDCQEEHTQIIASYKGAILKSERWTFGTNNIIEQVSDRFNVSWDTADNLFNRHGQIPPADVIDNKPISLFRLGNRVEVFSKRDLSEIVTENIREMFQRVEVVLGKLGNERVIINFSGAILGLDGFLKYSRYCFGWSNVANGEEIPLIGTPVGSSTIINGVVKINRKPQSLVEDNPSSLSLPKKYSFFSRLKSVYSYF